MEKTEKIFRPPPWRGEFGWEIMSWAPRCRFCAQGAARVVIESFAASEPLYADFATEFIIHGADTVDGRDLRYPKGFGMYHSERPGFAHRRYGRRDPGQRIDVLVHARGVRRKSCINYRRWPALAAELLRMGVSVATVGTPSDGWLPGVPDWRGLPLAALMDVLASAGVVVGASSGVMHLAAACGADLVCWGDTKTRYRETLAQRYQVTWNPHGVRVGWLDADDWDPAPRRIAAAIASLLSHGDR